MHLYLVTDILCLKMDTVVSNSTLVVMIIQLMDKEVKVEFQKQNFYLPTIFVSAGSIDKYVNILLLLF